MQAVALMCRRLLVVLYATLWSGCRPKRRPQGQTKSISYFTNKTGVNPWFVRENCWRLAMGDIKHLNGAKQNGRISRRRILNGQGIWFWFIRTSVGCRKSKVGSFVSLIYIHNGSEHCQYPKRRSWNVGSIDRSRLNIETSTGTVWVACPSHSLNTS